jgi:hypothetical protein
MYTINENENENNQKIKGKAPKRRGPCFLPQTQKHVHNTRKKQIS